MRKIVGDPWWIVECDCCEEQTTYPNSTIEEEMRAELWESADGKDICRACQLTNEADEDEPGEES